MDVEAKASRELDRVAYRLLMILFENRRKAGKSIKERYKESRAKIAAALRNMAERGLVRYETDERGFPAIHKARAVELTDAGAEHVLRSFRLPPQARPTGATVNAVLDALREALRAAEARPAAAPPARAAAEGEGGRARDLRAEILRAFRERERVEHGVVPIWMVRRAIPEAALGARDAFDRALLDLQREGLLYLNQLNDPRGVPEDQIRDGLLHPVRGRLFFISRGDKPWDSTTPS